MESHIDTWAIGTNGRTLDKQQTENNMYFHTNQEKSYLSHGIEQIVDNLTRSSHSQTSQPQTSNSIYQPYNLKDSNSDSGFNFAADNMKVSSLAMPSISYMGTPDRQMYQREPQLPGSIEALLNYPSTFPTLPVPTTKDNFSLKNLKFPLVDSSTDTSSTNSFTGFNGKDTGLAMLSSLAHTRSPIAESSEHKRAQRHGNAPTESRKTSHLNLIESDNLQSPLISQLQNRTSSQPERPLMQSSSIVEPATRLSDVTNFNILSYINKSENQNIYNREDNAAAEVISITVENMPYSNAENNILYYPDSEAEKTIHIRNDIDSFDRNPNLCDEDNQVEKYVYNCGACDLIFGTICHLYIHIESHGSFETFLYDKETKTVYPKLGLVSNGTQTDLCCKDIDSMLEKSRESCDDGVQVYTEMNRNVEDYSKLKESNTAEISNISNFPVIGFDNEKVVKVARSQKLPQTDIDRGDLAQYSPDNEESDYTDINDVSETNDKGVSDLEVCHGNEKKWIARKCTPNKTSRKKLKTSNVNAERLTLSKHSQKVDAKKPDSNDLQNSTSKQKSAVKQKAHKQDTEVQQSKTKTKKEVIQCSLCHEKFDFPIRLKRHLESTHGIQKMYSCKSCPEQFQSFEELRNHRQRHRHQIHKCKLCDKVVSTAASLRDHMNFHMGIKPHECTACGNFFRTTGQLNAHIREKHDNSFSQQCESCGKTYTSRSQIREHRKQCLGIKPHKCNTCGKRFVRSTQLRIHERTHSGEKPYICDICGCKLTNYSSLIKHKRIHTGEKPYKCDSCNQAFNAKTTLNDHMKTHTQDKQYHCTYCGRSFIKKWNLKTHLRQHTGEAPYKCKICGQGYKQNAFTAKTTLNDHLRTHTQDKQYHCTYCGRSFIKKWNLKTNLRQHTGEALYKCKICGQGYKQNVLTAFNAKTTLNDHLRTHTQDKQYHCTYCGRSFIKKWNLKTHLRQHTGEAPYKCKICGQGYKQNVLLKTHMQTHNKPVAVEPATEQMMYVDSSQMQFNSIPDNKL